MSIEKKYNGEGGYVFVSHSHHDIKDVREIRNYLEGEGLEPILFYLKSMDDGDTSKEALLKHLIYDEIDARQFFLYLDSQNARSSKWVSEELEYVKARHPERLIPVDLKQDKALIFAEIEKLVKSMRVFMSYHGADTEIAVKLKERLIKHDFRVFCAYSDITAGSNYAVQIVNAIKEASQNGIIIVLITESSKRSHSVMCELDMAFENDAKILPVVVGDVLIDGALQYYLGKLQHLKLPANYTDEDLDALTLKIRKIARRV